MRKQFMAASVFSLLAATASYGENDTIYKAGLSPTFISVVDNANGGCWTNIGESRNYVKDQLELAGLKVVDTRAEAVSTISLHVIGERLGNGDCFGSFQISIWAWATWQERRLLVSLTDWSQIFARSQNANLQVLEGAKHIISEVIAEYPD